MGEPASVGEPAADEPVRDVPGDLIIDNRVLVTISTQAAREVDGVVSYSTTLGSLIGSVSGRGSYPSATVDRGGAGTAVAVNIAVGWPSPITRVCQQVRAHVTAELTRLAGVIPTRVDVSVQQVLTPQQVADRQTGRAPIGYVTLGSPPPAAHTDETDTTAEVGAAEEVRS